MHKSKIKNFLPNLLVLTLIFGTLFTSFHKKAEELENETNPGYTEQFQLMKQNENGEIPAGLWKTWRNQRQSMRKTSFFSSVREIGPSNIGGRARAIIVDRANSTRLIAGGVSGGIWISENSGVTWTPLDDAASTLSVTAITQSPFNHKIIYYSTGEVSNGTHVNMDGNGIFKSVDGGKTFSQLASTNQETFYKTWDVEHSLTDSNTFYVATIGNGLWGSTDGGATVNQLFKSNTPINDVEAMPNGTVYFTKEGSGLYRFMEGDSLDIQEVGKTGLPTSTFGRCMVAPSQSDPNIIYLGIGGANRESLVGIYKSTNGGNNWTRLNTRSQTSYGQIWHNFLLKVHPTNPNIIVSGGVTAEFSTNGGSTWQALLNTHADYHSAAFIPGGTDFLTVSDGGVYQYKSSNAGNSAINRNGNFNITQFYCGSFFPESDGEKVIAGAQDNFTTINNTGGSVFTNVLGGDGAFNAVGDDGSIIYASSQNGEIRRSSGSSWLNISSALKSVVGTNDFWFINPFEIHPDNGQNIFFPTKNRVARSINGGSTWSSITNTIPGNIFSVGITSDQNPTVYLGGQSSLLYRVKEANTVSAGTEFKMFTLGPLESRGGFIGNIEIDPNDKSTIYLAMSNYSSLPRIWKVEDADTDFPTWVNISSNLPESLPVNWIEVDPKNSQHIIIATDYGVYITTNGGGWWEKELRIPNVYVSQVKLRHSDRKLFVFTFGRGAWVADLEDNIFASAEDVKPLVLSAYPNPANSTLNIGDVNEGSITFIDLSGRTVYSSEFTNGKVMTSQLKEGTYFVKVINRQGEIRNAKVLIQH